MYRSSKAALQKVLGVGTRATARDLCIQYGCARHDAAVRACLAAFKERYVRSLPEVQRAHVDFGRAVFLAAAFYMVARKNKVQVDRTKLLGPLGVTATEFAQVGGRVGVEGGGGGPAWPGQATPPSVHAPDDDHFLLTCAQHLHPPSPPP